ncbi:MAG: methionyl-tRNA formyltransferase [Bacteroidota bacterium]|nr:methionyl-tRNA formyltransferase [Bacteroidota bacterium]
MNPTDFRIIFMGTPEFAVGSLKALLDAGFNVVAVVTAPDKPAGRGQKLQEPDVKRFAKDLGIPILQPEKLKDPEFIEQLQSFKADLQVVVAFRMLPEIVWSMPRLGTINLHGSLLPQYRGAAPINWAIINGDKITGTTTFFIEKEIDTGKIIFKNEVEITDTDNAGTLHDKLMNSGAQLLVKTVKAIEAGEYPQVDQSFETALRPAPKIFKETCKIKWNDGIDTVYNFIRGLSPYPAAWTTLVNKETGESLNAKIFATEKEYVPHSFEPGTLVTDEKKHLKASLNGGYLHIKTIQVEGKKRLEIDEFLRGFKNINGYKLV